MMSTMKRVAAVALLAAVAEAGAPGSRLNPYKSVAPGRGRRQDCSGQGTTWGRGIGPPPTGCGPDATTSQDSASPGDASSSSSHAASLLGPIAFTTVAVSDQDRADGKFNPRANAGTGEIGEDIYGPFEAGFTARQDSILEALGCSNPADGYLAGGIDTYTAEQVTANGCSITLPRWDGDDYISLLDQCGGHTNDYHNHEKLICLYDEAAEGHSTRVGEATDDQSTPLYGKWEATGVLPELDACGGHWGVTPDSNGESIYHYHVQDSPPFTIGCFGPNDEGGLVTVEECRSYYSGCTDPDVAELNTGSGVFKYDLWCPCYDGAGSNHLDEAGGYTELKVFAAEEAAEVPVVCAAGYSGADCTTNIDDCASQFTLCQNGGTCADGVNSYTCSCAAGYSGDNCETNIDNCADGETCSNHGTCVDGVDTYTCNCDLGYEGTECAINIDDCAPNPCQNGGSCADGANAYTCTCAAGYSGLDCKTNIDECATTPCQNGGSCADGVNTYTCTCAAGYSGSDCDTNIDECATTPCQNGGSCTDGVNSYTCSCEAGYSGTDCETQVPVFVQCSALYVSDNVNSENCGMSDVDGAGEECTVKCADGFDEDGDFDTVDTVTYTCSPKKKGAKEGAWRAPSGSAITCTVVNHLASFSGDSGFKSKSKGVSISYTIGDKDFTSRTFKKSDFDSDAEDAEYLNMAADFCKSDDRCEAFHHMPKKDKVIFRKQLTGALLAANWVDTYTLTDTYVAEVVEVPPPAPATGGRFRRASQCATFGGATHSRQTMKDLASSYVTDGLKGEGVALVSKICLDGDSKCAIKDEYGRKVRFAETADSHWDGKQSLLAEFSVIIDPTAESAACFGKESSNTADEEEVVQESDDVDPEFAQCKDEKKFASTLVNKLKTTHDECNPIFNTDAGVEMYQNSFSAHKTSQFKPRTESEASDVVSITEDAAGTTVAESGADCSGLGTSWGKDIAPPPAGCRRENKADFAAVGTTESDDGADCAGFGDTWGPNIGSPPSGCRRTPPASCKTESSFKPTCAPNCAASKLPPSTKPAGKHPPPKQQTGVKPDQPRPAPTGGDRSRRAGVDDECVVAEASTATDADAVDGAVEDKDAGGSGADAEDKADGDAASGVAAFAAVAVAGVAAALL